MDQLRATLAGPHGAATIVTWVVAGVALVIATAHTLRPAPDQRRWSRLAAVGFPLAVACTLLAGSVAASLRGPALDVAMAIRMVGFWGAVLAAPFAVGQVLELQPPAWLHRAHAALAGTFLVLLLTSDLAFTRGDVLHPPTQFGPLAVALLTPVAALAGWWLLACLGRVRTRTGLFLLALGGSITTLALIVAGLVVDPVLADHFLVVGFLPVLAATTLLELHLRFGTWGRGPRARARPATDAARRP